MATAGIRHLEQLIHKRTARCTQEQLNTLQIRQKQPSFSCGTKRLSQNSIHIEMEDIASKQQVDTHPDQSNADIQISYISH